MPDEMATLNMPEIPRYAVTQSFSVDTSVGSALANTTKCLESGDVVEGSYHIYEALHKCLKKLDEPTARDNARAELQQILELLLKMHNTIKEHRVFD